MTGFHSEAVMSKKESSGLKFPRLEGITPKVKLGERLIWRTYNRLRPGRGNRRGKWGGSRAYDVYQQKGKLGHTAQIQFLILARELLRRHIDPIRYVKVMSNYGKYATSWFLPHPTWLANEKTLEQYEWLQYGKMNRANRQEAWQKLRGNFRAQDILWAVEQAGEFLRGAIKNFKMTELEAVIAFIGELNPWFVTVYVCSAPKKQADVVAQIARTQEETHRDIKACLKFFVQNKPIFRRAKETLLRVLK